MNLIEAMKAHLSTLPLRSRFAYAVRLLWGVPYQWGGEDILGTDCSGSVSWGLYLLGFSLRVTAMELYRNFTQPLYTEAQAGDLIFFLQMGAEPVVKHVAVFSAPNIIMDADRRFMDRSVMDEIASRPSQSFVTRRLDFEAVSHSGREWGVSSLLHELKGALA